MSSVEISKLVTLNLKYGTSSKPLKTSAFAQLSAKVLYILGEPTNLPKLKAGMVDLLEIKNISDELILDGLNYLTEQGKAIQKNSEWMLTPKAQKEIDKDISEYENGLTGVLERHFPNKIDKKDLNRWFEKAVSHFFYYHGEEWVKAVGRRNDYRSPKFETIDELISPYITEFKLDEYKEQLIKGFVSFLSSNNLSDQKFLMTLGLTAFSAQLITVDVGADPITLDEIRDSKILLDTNVLFAIALENHRLAKSIVTLGKALESIGAKLVYLRVTREEYERALAGRRSELLHLIKYFPNETLQNSSDDFVATAKARGCNKEEDYEIFFDGMKEIPEKIDGGPAIKLEEYEEINKAVSDSESDIRLQQNILAYNKKLRHARLKRENALKHDAAMYYAIKYLRKEKEKSWILSLDNILRICLSNETGPHDTIPILSVDVLIEILALNNAGPDIDASDFAPLLANILLNHCTPPENAYTLDDLQWLLSINEKAASLPFEKSEQLIQEVSRARLQGKAISDTSLQLKVNRMFREKLTDYNHDLEVANKIAKDAEDRAEKYKADKEKVADDLKSSERKRIIIEARDSMVVQIMISVLIICIVGYGVYILRQYLIPPKDSNQMLNYVGTIANLLFPVLGIIPGFRAIKDYLKVKKSNSN